MTSHFAMTMALFSPPQDPEVPAVRILRHLGARHQRRAARAHGVSAHGGDDARAPGGSGGACRSTADRFCPGGKKKQHSRCCVFFQCALVWYNMVFHFSCVLRLYY